MSYRIEETSDGIAVLALDEECFPQDVRVRLDGARWWLVRDGRSVIGFAGLRRCGLPVNRGLGFLCRVGIAARHRGHGLQKRLIRVRERAARAEGLEELVTYCAPWNLASANSLIACGFRLYRPAERWGGAEALYWRKSFQ
jgi:RimJ/RimL family protein N-acetyltransferase